MIRLIAKNIASRPVRNGALFICFAFIAASLFVGHVLMAGATASVQQELSRLGADIVVVPAQYTSESEAVLLRGEPSTFFFDRSVIYKVQNVSGVAQAAPQTYIATLPADCCSSLVQLIAIDPDKDFTIAPWLSEHQQKPLGKDEIILGSGLVGKIGSAQYYYGHAFVVAGRLEPTGTGIDYSVFLREEDARVMAKDSATAAEETLVLPENNISAVLVRVQDPAQAAEVAERITDQVPGVRVLTPQSLVSTVATQLDATVKLLDLATFVAILVSLPLIAIISLMVANERMREIGILRALGATKKTIFSLIFGESLVLALLGGITGVLVSLGGLLLFEQYIAFSLGIPLALPAAGALASLALTTILVTAAIGAAAAVIPAIHAARTEPYEAIRSGEL
ncbi:MAG: FtsX-like permease family protein [Methanoregula sp.]|jgi:putative ABC transport system permease protein